jgi:hypothetical protein
MTSMRSLTFLDHTGDTTIAWDETTDAKMIAIIEARMAQGYQFYVLKERRIPYLPPRRVRAKSIEDVKAAGAVVILDDDLDLLFTNGHITTMQAPVEITPTHKSRDAKELASSQSVAVKPARGG